MFLISAVCFAPIFIVTQRGGHFLSARNVTDSAVKSVEGHRNSQTGVYV